MMAKPKKPSHVRGNKAHSGQYGRPRSPRDRRPPPREPKRIGRRDEPRYDSTAPYNFVPLPESALLVDNLADFEVKVGNATPKLWDTHNLFAEGKHSGVIELTLTTETETYIRCALPAGEKRGANDAPTPDFFSYGDPSMPVIPGSSIRGMVRTLVEILSFGKFTSLDGFKQLIYRAVGDTTSHGDYYRNRLLGPNSPEPGEKYRFEYPIRDMHGGFLKKRGMEWTIVPSKEYKNESIVHIPCTEIPAGIWGPSAQKCRSDPAKDTPQRVYIIPPKRKVSRRGSDTFILEMAIVERISTRPQPDYVEAWVIPSGWMKNKKFFRAIYGCDENADEVHVPRDMWELYEDDAAISRGIKNRSLGDGSPVFYLLDASRQSDENPSGLVFFGPTMMFRLPYMKSIGNHVPEHLRGSGMDLAEALFGTVRSAERTAVRGRLRFGDALLTMENGSPLLDPNGKTRMPKILSGPKPTSFQHYLEQKANDKKQLLDWDRDAVIRGHKLYWHKKNVKPQDIFEEQSQSKDGREPKKRDTQHTLIRPIKRGVTFRASVAFDNLCDIELGALLTALDLPESKRHKLGMGKPLGMGTVRIRPVLKIVSRTKRYEALFFQDGTPNQGWVDQAGTHKIADRARTSFEKLILEHSKSQVESIWNIPRLKHLAELLEWDNAPPMDKTGYMELPLWKERYVLPSARGVRSSNTRPAQKESQPAPREDRG